MEPIRILLVEDEAYIRKSLQWELALVGHSVHCAADGAEGWQQITQGLPASADRAPFDLVITDLKMPRLDGLELLYRIHEHLPELPVIIITGYGDMEKVMKALRCGASDFIPKPFEPELVHAAIRRALATVQRRRETAVKEKLASLGTMAKGMAHEFNNPLSVVIGVAECLLDLHRSKMVSACETTIPPGQAEIDEAAFQQYVSIILASAQRCAAITEQLKTYNLWEPSFAREDCDLNTIIRESAAQSKARRAGDNHVQVKLSLFPSLPVVRGNRNKLRGMFTHLLDNACDAIGKNTGTIAVSTRVEPDGSVVIAVTDTGVGIRKEEQVRVLDPFYTTKDVGQGMGLGLFVVAGVVQEHGGTLRLESQEHKETTVTIEFPAAQDRERSLDAAHEAEMLYAG